jgi:hypothetical protein
MAGKSRKTAQIRSASTKRNRDFPFLTPESYKITSPQDSTYNCIAWAASTQHIFWWPDPERLAYWPKGVRRDVTVEAFIDAFATLGFIKCKIDTYEENFEKICLFTDSNGIPTHMARQLKDGTWTSKIGQNHDIQHESLSCLEGGIYGYAFLYLKKPRK